MFRIRPASLGVVVSCLALVTPPLVGQTRLLRFPAISGDKVAFTYAGDLWTAPVTGGTATRLTAHQGMEVFAHFSPDGKWIAFTGQYDGDEQVYVVPASGGVPRQLTFYPARGPLTPRWGWDNQVYGWSADGKSVLFRSMRDGWTLSLNRLYTVPMTGGPAEPLPMPEAGAGDYSPDGTKVVYSPIFRDFRPEKRYSGGMANDLFIFDTKANDAKRIINEPRSDRDPMWMGNAVYFNSDRSGTFNLYGYDVASGKTTELTAGKTWDVRWPSSDHQSRIVYELNGELQIFDTRTGKSTPVPITVPDDGLWKRPSRIAAANQIEDWDLSPKGERALFTARGDIFTAPIENGPTRNLTRSSGAHDKWASWSPDGARIAFISDQSGEEELYVVAQDGSGKPEQLTRGGKAMRYAPAWAPDGKRIALSDMNGKLYVYSFEDKKLSEIAHAPSGTIRDYVWSPRGNYLAWSAGNLNNTSSLYVWGARDGQVHKLTDPLWNCYNPAWDPDGSSLFYLSDRDYAPVISGAEFNYATNRTTDIYALTLRKDGKNPFPPESDEVTMSDSTGGVKPNPAPGIADLGIDFDGLGQRVTRVPVEADNYFGLSAKKGALLFVAGSTFYYGRQSDKQPALKLFSFKDRKVTTLVDGVAGYALSTDGSKVLARSAGAFSLYEATATGSNSKKAVSTAGLMVDRVPVEEWSQIFHEVWRRYRDWFYVGNMHGFDWDAIGKRYEGWLPYVSHRSDLNYLISEMISELTIQHAYVEGGDFELPRRVPVALLGARLALDPEVGRYRIAKIFQGQNEEPQYRSPLTEVGVNVTAGDYLLAINGVELDPDRDPYQLLRGAADRQVMLTINSRPTMEGARTVSVRPITTESDLEYLDWVLGNRKRVEQLSGGRIGYLHVPDMGAQGLKEFIKWYYPQLDKEALVVDVRANGGGNVSRMLIERLRRKVLGINYGRGNPEGQPYPDGVFLGPMAAILDERSSSDGDIFPYMFREAGLGPLIGRRSWGGVVGINSTGPLIDGGTIFVPLSGLANSKGEWVIEGHGVDPDIDVENDPKDVLAGHDPQLERTVAELMKQIQGRKIGLPAMPPAPVKVP